MNTSTEYSPTSSSPFSVAQPPSSSVQVKPARIAIRTSGTNAADCRIAARFACR